MESSPHTAKKTNHLRTVLLACLLVGALWAFFNRNSSNFGFNLSGKPSADSGRRVVEGKIARQGEGAISLVSFKKLNGVEREMLGQKFYEMEYEVEIQFSRVGAWLRHDGGNFNFSAGLYGNNAMAQLGASIDGAVNVAPFQKAKAKSTLVFEKTEKGWKGEDDVIY